MRWFIDGSEYVRVVDRKRRSIAAKLSSKSSGANMTMIRGTLSRRHILKMSAAVGTLGAFSPIRAVLAQTALRRTQDQILGPFYPVMAVPNQSGDLTRLRDGVARAKGQV